MELAMDISNYVLLACNFKDIGLLQEDAGDSATNCRYFRLRQELKIIEFLNELLNAHLKLYMNSNYIQSKIYNNIR